MKREHTFPSKIFQKALGSSTRSQDSTRFIRGGSDSGCNSLIRSIDLSFHCSVAPISLSRSELLISCFRWCSAQMNRLRVQLLLLIGLSCVACSTRIWDYPFPTVPAGKSPDERSSFYEGHFRHDSVERDPKHKTVFANINAEVDEAVKRHPMRKQFGFSHTRSEVQRRILYWKYGIDWLPPASMTPWIMVD